MALNHSPQVVTNGLVYYHDMGNTQKSWKGAPTTNRLPSPQLNGRFNIGNVWGTYNTHLYNNNTYFAIGGIAGVSGNIVTTTTAHPFTTYDVIRPQTTGGGVTAGADYFVKVLSPTTFSLHAYNSSQDGSQGYINPATGTHKVFDSIMLNQQISINATNFPTMWWGPPHFPNQSHVKEIIATGGVEYGTPCMRIHVTRTTGVSGGMAYGVDTPVTIGDVITVSFWSRAFGAGIGQSISYSTYFGPSASGYSGTWTPTAQWQKVTFQWTASATYSFIQYFFFSAAASAYYVEMADLQVETNIGVATPYVAGTRSNTQAILDLTGKRTVTATSLIYASDNTFSFNGSTTYITAPNTELFHGTNGFSYSIWANWASLPSLGTIFENGLYTAGILIRFQSNAIAVYAEYSATTYQSTMAFTPTIGLWYNLVLTREGNVLYLYANGVQIGTTAFGTSINIQPSTNLLYIGMSQHSAGQCFNGKIAIASIYNRALSAAEVAQNFNALKGRYGL